MTCFTTTTFLLKEGQIKWTHILWKIWKRNDLGSQFIKPTFFNLFADIGEDLWLIIIALLLQKTHIPGVMVSEFAVIDVTYDTNLALCIHCKTRLNRYHVLKKYIWKLYTEDILQYWKKSFWKYIKWNLLLLNYQYIFMILAISYQVHPLP